MVAASLSGYGLEEKYLARAMFLISVGRCSWNLFHQLRTRIWFVKYLMCHQHALQLLEALWHCKVTTQPTLKQSGLLIVRKISTHTRRALTHIVLLHLWEQCMACPLVLWAMSHIIQVSHPPPPPPIKVFHKAHRYYNNMLCRHSWTTFRARMGRFSIQFQQLTVPLGLPPH